LPVIRRTSGSTTLASLAACAACAACAAALLGALALACSSADATQAPCANANLRVTGKDHPAIDRATLCLIDGIRLAHGLPKLRSDHALGAVARKVVAGMVLGNYFADVTPSGASALGLISASGYAAGAPQVTVGQNLAWGTGSQTTPARIVAAWMASPPHRANILDSEFRNAGVAVTTSVPSVLHVGRRGATYVFEFAARLY